MSYFAPVALDQALDVLRRSDASIVAGGTDFYPGLNGRKPPRVILDPTNIRELKGIARTGTGWRIGAAATWSELIRTPLPRYFDGLKAAGREVGSIQIQNAGTVVGNLCNASPAADGVPPFLALDAEVEIASPSGSRRVPLANFVRGIRKVDLEPGELVVAVRIPSAPEHSASSFLKLGSRKYLVISIVMIAVVAWTDDRGIIEGMRIAVGACSPVAMRLKNIEAKLVGMRAEDVCGGVPISTEDLSDLAPIDDIRGSAEYRLAAAAELCRRGVADALAGRDG